MATLLRTPVVDAEGKLTFLPTPLLEGPAKEAFGEHADRRVLAQAGQRIGYQASQLDYLGRWKATGSEMYWIDARGSVLEIQRNVASALRRGCPKVWDEEVPLRRLKKKLAARVESDALEAMLKRLAQGPALLGQPDEVDGSAASCEAAPQVAGDSGSEDENRSDSGSEAEVKPNWY